MLKTVLRDLYFFLIPERFRSRQKYRAEVAFWRKEIAHYVHWYEGRIPSHFNTPSPGDSEKVIGGPLKDCAILTWAKRHQEIKYLVDLSLSSDAFRGMKVLDIGSGPIPSGLVFEECELYCLDPLLPQYWEAGFPLRYDKRAKFVGGLAEWMPFKDHAFDAVISVNAIDHVDDFMKAAQEVRRVLKPGGKLRMHVHYHKATITEPLELNDSLFSKAYGWIRHLEKLKDTDEKYGSKAGEGERYVLWSGF